MTAAASKFGGKSSDGFILIAVLWILGGLAVLATVYMHFVVNAATSLEVSNDRIRADASVSSALELTAIAQDAGADAVLVITPYYARPTQEGLFHWYDTVAREFPDLPMIAYNVPSRTAVDIAPETVARLRKAHANIVGVKETTKDFEHFSRVLHVAGRDTLIWSGIELLCLPLLSLGGVGFVSATANLAPRAVARMYEHWESGELEQAREVHFALHPVTDVIFTETNPAAAKWVLAQAGLIASGFVRPPLVPLTESGQATALQLLREGAPVLDGPVAKVAA